MSVWEPAQARTQVTLLTREQGVALQAEIDRLRAALMRMSARYEHVRAELVHLRAWMEYDIERADRAIEWVP